MVVGVRRRRQPPPLSALCRSAPQPRLFSLPPQLLTPNTKPTNQPPKLQNKQTVAGQEMAEALTPDVVALLSSGAARPIVRKKAALCLLRLVRKTPVDQQLVRDCWVSRVLCCVVARCALSGPERAGHSLRGPSSPPTLSPHVSNSDPSPNRNEKTQNPKGDARRVCAHDGVAAGRGRPRAAAVRGDAAARHLRAPRPWCVHALLFWLCGSD